MNNANDGVTTCIRHAAALIEKCGWTQGTMGNPVDGFCILGALGMACGGNRELFHASCKAVAKTIDTRHEAENAIAHFNDEEGRHKEQVVLMLQRAATSVVNDGACFCDSCKIQNGYAKVTGVSKTEMQMTKEAVEDAAAMMAHMPSLGVTYEAMWIGGKEVPVPPGLGSFEFPIGALQKKPKRKTKNKSKAPKPQLADMLA